MRYSLLPQQFAAPDAIFRDLRRLVASGDYTLGKPVQEFEERVATAVGRKHAIGVGSGTDSLKISLKAIGIEPGDEVITAANTFIATVGAINEVGAHAALVDCDDSFCINPALVERAIRPRTKAIMPVHIAGNVADIEPVADIARRRGLLLVEDGCQSLFAERNGKQVGSWGVATGFSMHPLKIINVWGDAGFVVTDDDKLGDRIRLLRNHGLRTRDEIEVLGYNTRLDSVQAVVGLHMLPKAQAEIRNRQRNAALYDAHLGKIPEIRIPPRDAAVRHIQFLYIIFAERRDELYRFCIGRGVEVKIHYPIPLYHQKGLQHLGYKPGDFPVTDRHAREMITLPVDQFLGRKEIITVIDTIKKFYGR